MMHVMNKIGRATLNPTLAAVLRFVEFWSCDGKDVERVDDGFAATTAVIFWMLVLKMVITFVAILSEDSEVIGVAVISGPKNVADN